MSRLPAVQISELQDLIARTYAQRDAAGGVPAAVAWLAEEVGELARALRKGSPAEQAEELADVLAWLASLAHMAGLDLEAVTADRYGAGCPKCSSIPCRCDGLRNP